MQTTALHTFFCNKREIDKFMSYNSLGVFFQNTDFDAINYYMGVVFT